MVVLNINSSPPIKFTIVQGGLNVSIFKNPNLPSEELIPFENIKVDRFFYIQKSPLLLIAAGFCLIIYCLIIFSSAMETSSYPSINHGWAVLSIVFFTTFFLYKPKVYFIKTVNGKFIRIKVRNNESEVSDFVKTLFEKRKEYLRSRYGKSNAYMSYDAQFSNFNILLREGIITQEEYHNNIDTLNKTFEQTYPRQTYSGYSQN